MAGAGKVALRKVRGLLEAGARVKVVSPEGVEEFAALPVEWVRRRYESGDLEGARLAFAATNHREVNQRVKEDAERLGIWVNVADAEEECGFLVPARVRRGDLQVAVSTSGRDPRMAVRLRKKIEAVLEDAERE